MTAKKMFLDTRKIQRKIKARAVLAQRFATDIADVADDIKTELRLISRRFSKQVYEQFKEPTRVAASPAASDERWFARVSGSLVPDPHDRGEIDLPW